MLEDLTPVDLELPSRFQQWRPIQREAIERGIYTDKRFLALAMPTGSGKSLAVRAISLLTGYRTVILTSTKGLANQYLSEFGIDPRAAAVIEQMTGPIEREPNDLVDIRGRNNYRCTDYRNTTCDDGPRIGCRNTRNQLNTIDCPYWNALYTARNAQYVVTNYKYWLHLNRPGSMGLTRILRPNPVELLVLDEAHLAPEELASFLAVRIYETDIADLLHTSAPESEEMSDWKDFAGKWSAFANREANERGKRLAQLGGRASQAQIETQKKFEALADKLDRLNGAHETGWICEAQTFTMKSKGRFVTAKRWEFDPVWPGQFAERSLFNGIPHIILVSATLRPKTLGLLGVKAEQAEFREWPRIFPANRNPIYSIPAKREDGTEIRINFKSKDQDLRKWVEQIDAILEARLDRKGIIHTVSYARQKYLLEHSRLAEYMIGNTDHPDSIRAGEIVYDFKAAQPPCILVSPSFSTGWDFPDNECEFQVITKVPFPNAKGKVMKARMSRDPQYLNYLAMQDLVQSCGRGMRHERDRCEVFIVDATISWFLWQNRSLAPKWFEVRKMAKIPKPPIALPNDTCYISSSVTI